MHIPVVIAQTTMFKLTKIFTYPTLILSLKFKTSILLPDDMTKTARLVANRVDPDLIPNCAASNQGLHCLLGSVCPNMSYEYSGPALH